MRQGDAHSWVEVYVDGHGWVRFDPTPPADAAPHGEINGVFAFVRDFVEATAQRWNRHVVGYDLKQQISIFRSVRDRYSMMRSRPGLTGALTSPSRLALIGLGLLLVGAGVVWLRRARGKGDPNKREPKAQEITVLRMVALYRALEGALAVLGAPRPPSVPPLAHSVALEAMGHPAGAEVKELTMLYIEARFGERELSEEERRDFLRRVRALKTLRSDERAAA